MWAAWIVAIFLIGGALLNEQSALRLLFGSSDYPEFKVDRLYRLLLLAAIPMLVILMAVVQLTFNDVRSQYASYVSAAEEKKAQEEAEKEREEFQRRIDEGIAASEARTERLILGGYRDIRVVRDDENLRITEAEKDVEQGELSYKEIRIEVDDRFGNDKLYVVFHLFENTAFWRFDSRQSFENIDGEKLDFLELLERSPLASTLTTYDSLIGVGLVSNSPLQPQDVADDRAKLLCAALTSYAGADAKVLGMSIGSYTKQPLDRRIVQQRKQRPVIILGVEKRDDAVSESKLLDEVIRSVEFSGTDLLHYEYLQSGRAPRWYEITRCTGRF